MFNYDVKNYWDSPRLKEASIKNAGNWNKCMGLIGPYLYLANVIHSKF